MSANRSCGSTPAATASANTLPIADLTHGHPLISHETTHTSEIGHGGGDTHRHFLIVDSFLPFSLRWWQKSFTTAWARGGSFLGAGIPDTQTVARARAGGQSLHSHRLKRLWD